MDFFWRGKQRERPALYSPINILTHRDMFKQQVFYLAVIYSTCYCPSPPHSFYINYLMMDEHVLLVQIYFLGLKIKKCIKMLSETRGEKQKISLLEWRCASQSSNRQIKIVLEMPQLLLLLEGTMHGTESPHPFLDAGIPLLALQSGWLLLSFG